MLSVIYTDYDYLVIIGDFYIHTDKNLDKHWNELSAIHDTFGLSQHVKSPTQSSSSHYL